MTGISRRYLLSAGLSIAGASVIKTHPTRAATPVRTVFENVAIFDGVSASLKRGLSVVVQDGVIVDVATGISASDPTTVKIDCGGRTLMPGLIDAHWHTMLAPVTIPDVLTADEGYLTLLAADEANHTLMRGFTSVRDMAGACFSLKKAIDSGMNTGPRIWPSGAIISQSGGHGDFRLWNRRSGA